MAVPIRALSILLIEADADWRGLLADALFASGHSVHQVADCRTGTELARSLSPHVILLGRTVDGTDLLEACWALRSVSLAALLVIRRRPADPGDCLVLEMGGAPGDVELLSLPQVVGRARMAWQPHRFDGAGGRTLPRGLDQETAGAVHVDRVARRVNVGDQELPLTPREFDLLSFLLANQGRVLSAATILAHVWTRRPTAQSLKTVAVHVRWLRRKLEAQRDLAIVTVRGAGYRLDVQPPDDDRPPASPPIAMTRLSKRARGRPERLVSMTESDGPGSQYTSYLADPLGVNRWIVEQYRANAGEVEGMGGPSRMLLLTTRGARSGAPHTAPMFYVADGDQLVVYASNVGAHRHPGWYHNVVAHPDVTVEVGDDRFEAVAVVATGDERERLWRLFPFPEHQGWTARLIPVVALVRHPG